MPSERVKLQHRTTKSEVDNCWYNSRESKVEAVERAEEREEIVEEDESDEYQVQIREDCSVDIETRVESGRIDERAGADGTRLRMQEAKLVAIIRDGIKERRSTSKNLESSIEQ